MNSIFLLVCFQTVICFLVNQIPGIKKFPGRTTFVICLICETVTQAVIQTALIDSNVKKSMPWLPVCSWIVAGVFILTVLLAVLVALEHKNSRRIETETKNDEQRRKELLVAESRNVEIRKNENLKDILIPLLMRDESKYVGQHPFLTSQTAEISDISFVKRLFAPVQKLFKSEGSIKAKPLLPAQPIIDVFYQADKRLLILGKPGSGKTTLLLELAAQLLANARQEGSTLIPVRLECSTWNSDRQSFQEWLTNELKRIHKIPLKMTQRWIDKNYLLPLLDGLDELEELHQKKAISAITEFIQTTGCSQIVVCCRKESFVQTNKTLFGLKGTVYLEPLNDIQIQIYLQQIGYTDLWEKIQFSDLQTLLPKLDVCDQNSGIPGLRSPLLLNMLLFVASSGQKISNIPELFDAYITEQFRRYNQEHIPPYSPEKTNKYLTFLAQHLKAEGITEFKIEDLQPVWLLRKSKLQIYRIIVGLIVGLIFGLIIRLVFGTIYELDGRPNFGLIAGTIFGLFLGLSGWLDKISTTDSFQFTRKSFKRGINFGIGFGLIGIIIVGVIGWLIAELLGVFKNAMFGGAIFGAIFGMTYGIIYGMKNHGILVSTKPNQGILNSFTNSVLIFVFTCPVGIPLFTLPRIITGQSVDWDKFPYFMLAGGLLISILPVLPLIQHGTLRFLLYIFQVAPWSYADFFSYANKIKILHKTEGSYRFIHDLLREHFIGKKPLPIKVDRIPDWKKIPILSGGTLIALSLASGIHNISPQLAQIMKPTLNKTSLVFFDQYSCHFNTLQHNELISFKEEDSRIIYYSWVVGLPGDKIHIDRRGISVSGKLIDPKYNNILLPNSTKVESIEVPADNYFVIGLKTDLNGRSSNITTIINRRQITGKLTWQLWPLKRIDSEK